MDLPHLDQLHCKVFPIFLQLEAHHHHHHHHKVYLYGVQVTSWKNDHGQELLFVNFSTVLGFGINIMTLVMITVLGITKTNARGTGREGVQENDGKNKEERRRDIVVEKNKRKLQAPVSIIIYRVARECHSVWRLRNEDSIQFHFHSNELNTA
ncbi:hypothetical protein ACSBR1_043206 [Camellia fascicularis]